MKKTIVIVMTLNTLAIVLSDERITNNVMVSNTVIPTVVMDLAMDRYLIIFAIVSIDEYEILLVLDIIIANNPAIILMSISAKITMTPIFPME